MAFTGDLEHLPIVDIIQLVHTTRKSGVFSVKGDKGESKIVFSSGYIAAASHRNSTIRIGTVLVKAGAITVDDLKQALGGADDAAQNRTPLMTTLMQMGKLTRENALRGLKQLVALTIVELMSWTKGTFTFDTETPAFASEGEEELLVDAQMVLMDALRIFDERERDRTSGKEVPSFEVLYADVLPGVRAVEPPAAPAAITADVLGLADLDLLEKKIPQPVTDMELFDPVEIHRQKVRELLADFSSQDQEAFVSFLKQSVSRKISPDAAAQQAGKAVVLFSKDKLIRHSLMTICKEERIPVFASDDEKDFEPTISQCLSAMRMPVVVFDNPGGPEEGFPEDLITELRRRIRKKHTAIPILQLTAPEAADFILQAYNDGVRAVLPKPLKEARRSTYVRDMINFLGTFTSYVSELQHQPETIERYVKALKKDIRALREVVNPSDAAMVMLAAAADLFERAVTFIVRPTELIGERAVGVSDDKSIGPTHADRLKIPLSQPSLFQEVIERGTVYYGESGDEALKGLYQEIGAPVSPVVALLPLISDRKVLAIVYGDFGKKEASPLKIDTLEILAFQVGMVLEYAIFRRQVTKAAQK